MNFRRLLPALAVTLVALAGCSAASQAPSTAAPAAPSPGASTTAFPVSITHAYGQTTIPAEPKRVVTIGYNEGDFPLALGVVPVGERQVIGDFDWQNRPWATAAKQGQQPQVLSGSDLSIEQVAALRPDLILGVYSFIDKATYDRLSGIAPTIAPPTDGGKGAAATWQDQTRITGKALGRSDRAEQVIGEAESKIKAVKDANAAFAGRSMSMVFPIQGLYSIGADDLRTQLFAGLGFVPVPTSAALSPENLEPIDKDVVVAMGQTEQQFTADPVFANMKATKARHVIYPGGFETPFAGALGFSSPLSLPYAADLIAPQLAQAIAR
ncbi:iron-siderophore ABC transporter substrate-binding protein [Pseudonocardia ailaonensis]|uniref:Iron-siderophore ABC transporter substrate-binding protein n=1 Tax=Pseudonocardia ailaonensis TaxID=367279 RepID=A0ABN2NBU5_9PSEU